MCAVNVLQLWLDCYNCLHHNGLDLVPNLGRWFSHPWTALLSGRLRHDTLQTVVETQLVSIVVKVVIFLIQRVVGQVRVGVVEILSGIILLRC